MRVEGCAWTVWKGKRKRLEKLEKNSSPFVFLSFGRRLVLKRWSQKFSFDASFLIFVPKAAPSCCEVQNTRALQKKAQKRGERERRRRSSRYPPPSSSRARSLLLLLDFFFFAPRFRVCWGKFRETKTERRCGERSGVCSFFSSYFFAFLSLSFALSASVLLRRVLVSCNKTTTVIFPPHKIKKVKALRERVCNNIQ